MIAKKRKLFFSFLQLQRGLCLHMHSEFLLISAAEVHLTLVQAEGLTKLVEHNNKKVAEKQLEGLKTELTEMITQDPPTPVDECLAAIKAKKAEFSLADSELVKVSSYTKSLFV